MRVNHPGTSSLPGNEASSVKQSGRPVPASETKRAERSSVPDVEKKMSPGANAEISQKSRELALAKNVATETPDIREDKVADLKKKISEGSYRVDSEAIADRLVDDHLKTPGIG